jgi:hypothetical protein
MKTTEDKIQKIELETVKAITELKSDVKNLTETIKDLRMTIQTMADNYVKRDEFVTFQAEQETKLDEAKKAGRVHSILWSLLTAIVTTLAVFEITRLIK